ncbi:MAG: hypothetical protein HY080_13870 [Gammaproteobacteria bacterium]|nr:hypothetical protein [Gammaproteobacteria bacterium]
MSLRLIFVVLFTGWVSLCLADETLEMQGTKIHGNVELPKVLYIVPWQQSELPEISQPPLESLIDEALSPVDREVFQRQIRYYDSLTAQDIRNSAKP